MSSSSDEDNNESTVEGTINAVTGLVEAVPIYEDAIRPAAKEIGKSLETIAKTINVALTPVTTLIWGYDQIKNFVDTRVAEKLQNVDPKDIISPAPHIAGPALESLRYAGTVTELRELYANLIASSMNKNSFEIVHPSFVEIINQLTPDEARILGEFTDAVKHSVALRKPVLSVFHEHADNKFIETVSNFNILHEQAGCERPQLYKSYFDNLNRLNLLHIVEAVAHDADYEELKGHPVVLEAIETINRYRNNKIHYRKKSIGITEFGKMFIRTCVVDLHQKK